MEINNKDRIYLFINSDFSRFTKDNQHLTYIVQVLLRKKDGHDCDNIPVYQKSINKISDYDRIIDNAIDIANKKNGRVYITVSPKNKEAVLLKLAQECINLNVNNSIQNKSIESVLYSVATKSGISPNPRIIFDFDIKDDYSTKVVLNFFEDLIKKYEDELVDNGIYYIPTVSGFHIISTLKFDYMNDDVIDMMSDEFKNIVKQSYLIDNHFDEIPKGTHFKRMFANLMHKDSGNTLVYYNKRD